MSRAYGIDIDEPVVQQWNDDDPESGIETVEEHRIGQRDTYDAAWIFAKEHLS